MTDRLDSKDSPTVEDLESLIATASRFMVRLGSSAAFKEAKVGLAEWSALRLIASADEDGAPPVHNKAIARRMGVTVQRAAQICGELKKVGYIEAAASLEDARSKSLLITPEGRRVLADLESKIGPVLEEGLSGKQSALRRADVGMKLLSRAFATRADNKPSAPPPAGI